MLLLSAIIYFLLAAADSSSGTDLINLLANASGPTVMAIVIIGAIKEWWIPGPSHKRVVNERDELLSLVIGSQKLGSRAVDVVETLTEVARHDKISNKKT